MRASVRSIGLSTAGMRADSQMLDPRRGARIALVAVSVLLFLAVTPGARANTTTTTFPYTYVNPDGSKTVIPSEPQRVVLVGQPEQEFDTVVSLGVHPVGVQARDTQTAGVAANGYPAWLDAGELKGVYSVGTDSPNFEAIASLKPDLIVAYSTYPAATIAQLQEIAPVAQVYPGTTLPSDQFPWEPTLLSLAPVFDATARAQQIVARLEDRTTALRGLIGGTSMALILPESAQNFDIITSDNSLGGLFQLAGVDLEGPLAGGPAAPATGNILESTELLPEISATKVLFAGLSVPSGVSQATTEAWPLYPEIPAVMTGQGYFTGWWMVGPIGTADALSQLQKEVFGVTGLEATLVGTGKQGSSRSGVADIDVGPTDERVCWDISTTGSIGHPDSAIVMSAKGAPLFTLGKGYQTTGCANITRSAATKLLSSPRYRFVIGKTTRVHRVKTVKTILEGVVGKQTPAFFGNGEDQQVNQ